MTSFYEYLLIGLSAFFVAIIIHELLHLFMARNLGYNDSRIKIRWFGFEVVINALTGKELNDATPKQKSDYFWIVSIPYLVIVPASLVLLFSSSFIIYSIGWISIMFHVVNIPFEFNIIPLNKIEALFKRSKL